MDSPIKWLGGKSKLRDEIIKDMPEHRRYIEVFGGALWVYFGKSPSDVEVVNDVHSELVNFYRIVKKHPECFIKEAQHSLYSREIYDVYRKIDTSYLTEIERAVRFFYMINIAFGSKWNGVFGISKDSRASSVIHDMGIIEEVHSRFRETYIEHLSYKDLIPKWDDKDSFFFCDPPYIDTAQYSNVFTYTDHALLAKTLRAIKGKFMVTINDCATARKLYDGFNFKEVKVMYCVSKEEEARKEYDELIITNYVIDENTSAFSSKNQHSLSSFFGEE